MTTELHHGFHYPPLEEREEEGGGPLRQYGYETSSKRLEEEGIISTTWVKHTDLVQRRSYTKHRDSWWKEIKDTSFYADLKTCVSKHLGELRRLFAHIVKFADIKWKNKIAIFQKEKAVSECFYFLFSAATCVLS